MNTAISPTLRRAKIQESIDTLRDEDLETFELFLIELEFDRRFNRVRESFGQAAMEGKLDRANEVITKVRIEK